ncbi:hypothetical protein WN48_01797 [Eufriesea mexicana]|uniref:Uncharacterized protein n=1 Tax=Eufriesea mexicana TaxID=516756 RepID=A0A310STI2_9HYME|nr:hypothetical protein WN48_01797 [Eufriesea mexicana]
MLRDVFLGRYRPVGTEGKERERFVLGLASGLISARPRLQAWLLNYHGAEKDDVEEIWNAVHLHHGELHPQPTQP